MEMFLRVLFFFYAVAIPIGLVILAMHDKKKDEEKRAMIYFTVIMSSFIWFMALGFSA